MKRKTLNEATGASTLLRATHFPRKQSATRMTRRSLTYDEVVGDGLRQYYAFTFDSVADAEEGEEERTKRVVANPSHLSSRDLLDGSPNDGEKRPSKYDRAWKVKPDGDAEGQELFLVAFGQDAQPVGHFRLRLSVHHNVEEKNVYYGMHLIYCWVAKRHRRKGFAIDLAAAAGNVVADVLRAIYRAAPTGTTIQPSIFADFVSDGGKHISDGVYAAVQMVCDIIREDDGARADVTVKTCVYEAGW